MKIEQNLQLCKLFDAYGALLSQSQRDVLGDYLLFDLTGSEIAENKNISRQAVKDSVNKAIKKLEKLEKSLHFVEKIDKITEELQDVKNQLSLSKSREK